MPTAHHPPQPANHPWRRRILLDCKESEFRKKGLAGERLRLAALGSVKGGLVEDRVRTEKRALKFVIQDELQLLLRSPRKRALIPGDYMGYGVEA